MNDPMNNPMFQGIFIGLVAVIVGLHAAKILWTWWFFLPVFFFVSLVLLKLFEDEF